MPCAAHKVQCAERAACMHGIPPALSRCACCPAGQFNEGIFQGLDYLLAEAAKRRIRLIIVPANLWESTLTVGDFERW